MTATATLPAPAEGQRYRSGDGTVYLIEHVTHITDEGDENDFAPTYAVELCEAAAADDMGAIGIDLIEPEWVAFQLEHGLALVDG